MGGVEWKGERVSVTLSGGVAAYGMHGTTPDSLIAAADGALYAAKHAGRNCILQAAPVRALESVTTTGRHARP
jgi:PleD family two-component response regulator